MKSLRIASLGAMLACLAFPAAAEDHGGRGDGHEMSDGKGWTGGTSTNAATSVPEPLSAAIFAAPLVGLYWLRRRRAV